MGLHGWVDRCAGGGSERRLTVRIAKSIARPAPFELRPVWLRSHVRERKLTLMTQPSARPWGIFPTAVPSLLKDLPILCAGLALFYGLLSLARYWTGPVNTQAEIQLHPSALPLYALFSIGRIAVAYALSLGVALVYGSSS